MKIENKKPLKINWIRKSVDSAESGMEILPDGRLHCWIKHEIIDGVTPEMLVWWFSHLEGNCEIDGREYNRYRVWHPEDHLFLSYSRRNADGSVGVGSEINLAEMLNGNPKYLVHIHTEIKKLDETGYIHCPRIHGIPVGQMDYTFEQCENGTLYQNSLTIGWTGILGRILNPFIRRFVFDAERGKAWIRHNIEEVGNFEFFLRDLYLRESGNA